MKKIIVCLAILIIGTSVALSGCQDTKSTTTEISTDKVILQSSIVKFANVSLEKTTNKSGGVESLKVSWRFSNIAGRMINASINVGFYNANNMLLYNETRELLHMPKGYTEQYLSPSANTVTLIDKNAASVDHIVISVTDM